MGKKRVVKIAGQEVIKESKAREEALIRKLVKKGKKLEKGRIYIQASYNNTRVTVTDEKGDVITWATAGSLGFSGPKKTTPFAASKVAEVVVERIKKLGVGEVDVLVSGIGSGRTAVLKVLASQNINIVSIKDITPIPHNGPRPKKVRRV